MAKSSVSIKKPQREKVLAFAEAKQKPKPKGSGLVPEGCVRLTANMDEDLHLRLKLEAAKQRTTIGRMLEDLVDRNVP